MIKNKTAKGITSLIAIIILMSSILGGSIYYGNNITANAAKEDSYSEFSISIQEVNNNIEFRWS